MAFMKVSQLITYLIHIQLTAVKIKLLVEILKHVDDHHRRCCSADGRKSDYVAKQHRNVRIRFRLDCLPLNTIKSISHKVYSNHTAR